MTVKDITDQLADIKSEEGLAECAEHLVKHWSATWIDAEVIEPILRFMESRPQWNFGMPGPLVHFLETFYGLGYEEKLTESIKRKPTPHTVWMLNRVIRGAKANDQRTRWLDLLALVASDIHVDAATAERSRRFLAWHAKRAVLPDDQASDGVAPAESTATVADSEREIDHPVRFDRPSGG